MNKIFKVIWSKSKQCYVVVSEMAKNKTGKKKIVVASILAALAMQVGVVADVSADESTLTLGGGKAANGMTNGVSIGNLAESNSHQSIAIGYQALATSQYANPAQPAVAIGAGAHATGRGGVSLGLIANSSVRGTAIGSATQATGFGAFAGGTYAQATNAGDVAIGGASSDQFNNYAVASGGYSVAIGTAAKADGSAGVSIGYKTNAKTSNSLAVGSESQATGEGAVAVGRKNTSTGASSTVLGILSTANATSATAVGMETTAKGENSLAVGHKSSASGRNGVAVGTNGTTAELGGVAVGQAAKSNKFNSVAMGMNVTADGDNSVALGGNASANSDGTIAIGSYGSTPTKATGNRALAIGSATTANGLESIAIGSRVNSTSQYSIAIGTRANASAVKSVAIGPDSIATVDGGVALGRDSVANVIGGVTNKGYNPNTNRTDVYSGLNGNVLTSTAGAVSIGNGSTVTRQLTGLAAGIRDTDAVNVAQLKSVNLAFSGNVNTGNVNIANSTLGLKGDNTYITTSANGQNLTISGKTQNIDVTNGQASANAAGMADSKNVADAINKAISANAYHWKLAADNTSTAPEVINKSDTVIFGGDNNITVTRSGKKITTSLNKAITVDTVKANKSVTVSSGGNQITLDGTNGSVKGRNFTGDSFKAGDNVLSNTTLQIGPTTGSNNVTITRDGLTAKTATKTVKFGTDAISAGGQQITNVSSGGNVGTNAANITDVKNAVAAVTLNLDTNSKTGSVKLSESPLKVIGANGIRTDLLGTNNGSLVVGLDKSTVNATTKGIGLTGDTGSTGLKYLKDGDATFKVAGDGDLVTTKASATGVQVAVDSAKVKDLAVGAVTVSKANTTDNPITITPTAGTNTKDYAIGIDTTKLANQTQLTYKANGANANKVSLANGLNFTDGTFTKATVGTNGTVTISTATETITNDADGKAKVNSPTDGLATAKNVADSINKAVDGLSQNLTVSDGATDGTVNLKNQKLTVSGTNGVSTTVNGQTVTVGLDVATKTKVDNASTAVARNISLGADSGTASSQSLKDGDVAFNVKAATGDLVSTKMNGNTVEISTKRAAITSDANTGAASVTGDDGLATSKNVADAINKAADAAKAGAAWNLTTNSSTTDKTSVQGGDTVDLINGDNILITQDGTDKKKITVATKKDLAVDSITAGNTVMNTSGLTNGTTAITGTGITTDKVTVGGISIDKTDGINGGNKTITNVASGGTTDTNAANIGDVKQAVANLSQNLNITDGTNNGTIDLKNQKLNVAGANGVTATVNNQTITVGLDDNTVNATTKGIGLTGDTGSTGNKYLKDGDVSFAVVGDGNLVSTSATATGVKVAVDAAKVKDLAVDAVTVSKDAQADNPITVTPTAGTNSKDYAIGIDTTKLAGKTDLTYRANNDTDANAQKVSLAKGLNFINGDTTVATVAADGKVSYDINTATKTKINDAATAVARNISLGADSGTASSQSLKDGDVAFNVKGATGDFISTKMNGDTVEVSTKRSTINSDAAGTASVTGDDGLATAKNVADAINKAASQAKDGAAWKLSANGDTPTTVAGGDTVDFTGDNNITVTQTGKNIATTLNKDLKKLKSISLENGVGETIKFDAINASGKFGDPAVGNYTQIDRDGIRINNGIDVNQPNTANTYLDVGTLSLQAGPNSSSLDSKNLIFNDEDGNFAQGSAQGMAFQSAAGKTIQFTLDEINAGGNKIKEVAEGTDDTDAVNVKQLKDTVASQTLTYRANSAADTDAKSVKLSKGLDFVDGTMTKATVDNDGKVTFDINDDTKTKINDSAAAVNRKVSLGADSGTTSSQSLKDGDVAFNVKGATGDFISTKMNGDTVEVSTKRATIDSNATTGAASVTGDDGLATAKNVADAINKAAKASTDAINLKFAGDTNTSAGVVNLKDDTLGIKGDGKYVTTDADGKNLTVKVSEAEVKKSAVSAVTVSTDTTDADNPLTVTGTPSADGTTKDYKVTIDGTKVATKTKLSYKANDGTAKQVSLADGLNFKDGTLTTATIDNAGVVKYDVKTAAITAGTDGTITGPATDGVATAKNVADAINAAKKASKTEITANDDEAANATTGNVKLTSTTAADGHTVYNVKLNDTLTFGTGANAIVIDGTAGKATIGSAAIDGVNNTITTGGNKAVTLDGTTGTITGKAANIGGVTVDGTNNHVTGLANTTWDGNAVSGRAATEDQLKVVADAAANQTWQITADKDVATSGKQTGTKSDAKVGKDAKVTMIAGENITINQNERDFTYSLNKDLVNMNSASFNGTGNNTTVINGDSITQTAGTQTNTSTAAGNTVADGTKSTATTADGTKITDGTKTNTSTADSTVIDDGNGNNTALTKDGVTITTSGKDPVSLTKDGLNNGGNKISNIADGTDDTDAVNVRQLEAKSKASKTELTANGGESAGSTTGNIVLTKNTAADGHIIYDNKLNDKVTLGTDPTKAVTVDGTNGTIKAGKDGNAVAINGTDGTIKAGDGANAVAIDGKNGSVKAGDKIALDGKDGKATIGTVGIDGKDGIITTGGNNPVAVNGKDGVVTGLTNKTWDPNNIASGRAATEDQVKSAVENAGWNATIGTEGSGINSTPTATAEKVKTDETVTFKAGNNMMVSQEGKTISYAVNPELKDMKSATFKDAAGNTTVTDGNGITITPGSVNPNNPNAGTISLTKDGLNNGNNQLKGVAPGTDDTDAVNVSQLKASNARIGDAIGQVAGEVQRVGAHAAAMAALKPIQYDPLEPTQVMAGVGNYRGETAAALGLAHYTNEDTMFNVGVSLGANRNMVNAGVTHKFGSSPEKKYIPDRYKAGPISSVYVMQDEVSSLKKENSEQKTVIADQAARLNTLEAENERQRQELAETKQGLEDLRAAVSQLLASKG